MPEPKLAVVLHIYYLDVAERALRRLSSLVNREFTLWVTVPNERRLQTEALVDRYCPEAEIRDFDNTGMDVLPFLSVLPELVERGHTAVVKLHTKRGADAASAVWGGALLDEMCREPVLDAIDGALRQYPGLDVVGLAPFYLSARKLAFGNEPLVRALINEIPGMSEPPADWGFFAGTMFAARTENLLPLASWATDNAYRFASAYQSDGLWEHALERAFCLMVHQGALSIGLIHSAPENESIVLQRVRLGEGISQAYSRELASQLKSFEQDYATLTQCELLDTRDYSLEGEVVGAVDLYRHYLSIGQFDQRVSASNAWSLKQHNDRRLPWDRWRTVPRESDLVSVVIPGFNQPELTEQCIRSLFAVRTDARFEVVCVDNGSEPDTKALLARLAREFPSVRVVRNETNLNFALGCNVGFGHSRGTRVVFLNNDTTVTDGWLDSLITRLDVGDCFGVQPQLRYPDGTLQCMGVVFSDKSPLGYPIYAKMAPAECAAEKPRQFKALTAACLALYASDFAEMKGFDALYINGQEDVDLCLRLHEHTGKLGAYVPDSLVVHHESKTEGRGTWIEQNRRVFVHRWKGRVQPDDLSHYQRDGFEVIGWEGDRHSEASGIRIYRPLLQCRTALGIPGVAQPHMSDATLALQVGDYSSAVRGYLECASAFPELWPLLETSLVTVKRVRRLRQKVPVSGVLCPGGRSISVSAGEVDCVLFLGRLGTPVSGANVDTHVLPETFATGAGLGTTALKAVVEYPLDRLYLVDDGPLALAYAEWYQLVWGAEVRLFSEASTEGVPLQGMTDGAVSWAGRLARLVP